MRKPIGYAIVLKNSDASFFYTGGYGNRMYSRNKTEAMLFDTKQDATVEIDILIEEGADFKKFTVTVEEIFK